MTAAAMGDRTTLIGECAWGRAGPLGVLLLNKLVKAQRSAMPDNKTSY
jgi:hypothetical protein